MAVEDKDRIMPSANACFQCNPNAEAMPAMISRSDQHLQAAQADNGFAQFPQQLRFQFQAR